MGPLRQCAVHARVLMRPRLRACRAACAAIMAQVAAEEPWFGIEQEYYVMDRPTGWPVGWSGYYDPGKTDILDAAKELTKMEVST